MFIYVISLKKIIVKTVFTISVIFLIIFSLFTTHLRTPISVFSQKRQIPIYSVESSEKKAAITFDCAWGADDINEILSILKNENVKATFFIVGRWAEKFPEAVRAIASDGHDIGNHGYAHFRVSALDSESLKKEIEGCNFAIEKITGNKVELFRAPYGDYSNNAIEKAKQLGMYSIQWNVDSLDWKQEISPDEIISRVMRKLNPGSILLFHNDTKHTAKLLPQIIKQIKNLNYTLIPVSELIIREDYEIDFEGRQKKIPK